MNRNVALWKKKEGDRDRQKGADFLLEKGGGERKLKKTKVAAPLGK